MSSGYRNVDVGCPFYRTDDGSHKITCEGIIDDSTLAIYFRKKKDYEIHISVFCCDHYQNCEVHQMLLEKYKEQ